MAGRDDPKLSSSDPDLTLSGNERYADTPSPLEAAGGDTWKKESEERSKTTSDIPQLVFHSNSDSSSSSVRIPPLRRRLDLTPFPEASSGDTMEVANRVRQENTQLQEDLESLARVAQRARTTGQWKFDSEQFVLVDPEKLMKFSSSSKEQKKRKQDIYSSPYSDEESELMALKSSETDDELTPADNTRDLEIRKLRSDLAYTQTRMTELQDKMSEKQRRLVRAESESAKLQRMFTSKNAEVVSAGEDARRLEQVIKEREERIAHYEQRIIALEAEISEAQEHYKRATEEVSILQSQLLDAENEQVDQTLYTSLRDELRSRDATIAKLQHEMNGLKHQRDRAIDETDNLTNKINIMEAALKRKSDELTHHEYRCKRLEEELDRHRSQREAPRDPLRSVADLDFYQSQCRRAQDNVRDLEDQLQRAQRQNKEAREALSTEIAERQNVITRMKGELTAMGDRNTDAIKTVQQRSDIIKQLREEVKAANAQSIEIKSNATELEQKLTTAELANEELNKEIIRLKSRLEGQNVDENDGSKLVNRLQNQVIELSKAVDERQALIRQLEARLFDEGEICGGLRHSLDRMEKEVVRLEQDLNQARQDATAAEDAKGRLEGKLQTSAIDARAELDFHIEELKLRDETIHRLRISKMDIEEILEQTGMKIGDSERLLEQTRRQLDNTNAEVQNLRLRLEEAETDKEMANVEVKDVDQRAISLEKEVRELRSKLSEVIQEREESDNCWEERVDEMERSVKDMHQLIMKNQQLNEKIQQRDDLLQKLSSETTRLKDKYQEKLIEISRQNELIQSMEMDSVKDRTNLENLQRQSIDEKIKLEQTIKNLQEDLLTAQNHYKSCYDEVVNLQDELSSSSNFCQETNEALKALEKELIALRMSRDDLEGQLGVSLERVSACQAQSAEMEEILRSLRSQLNTAVQEKGVLEAEYESVKEENEQTEKRLEEEREARRKQNQDMDRLKQEIAHRDAMMHEKDSVNQSVLHESSQLVSAKEDLECTLTRLKYCYQEEKERITEEKIVYKEELEGTLKELSQSQSQLRSYKQSVESLQMELTSTREDLDKATEELSRLKERNRQRESELDTTSEELEESKINLEEARAEITRLEAEVSTKTKYDQVTKGKTESLQSNLKQLEKSLSQVKAREAELETTLRDTRKDRETVGRHLDERKKQIAQCEIVISQMSEELTTTQKQLEDALDQTTFSEEQIQRLSGQVNALTVQVNNAEAALDECRHEFDKYRDTHSCHNKEIGELRASINTGQLEISELREVLTNKMTSLENLSVEHALLKQELDQAEKATRKVTKAAEVSARDAKVWQEKATKLEEEVTETRKDSLELAQLRTRFDDVQKELAHKTSLVGDLESSLNNSDQGRRLVQSDLSETTNRMNQLEEGFNQQCERADELEHHLHSTEQELEESLQNAAILESNLKSVTSELTRVKKRCECLEEEVNSLSEARERFQRELEREKGDIRQATQDINNKEHELHRVKRELESYMEQHRTLSSQIDDLNSTITRLHDELQRAREKNLELSKQNGKNKILITELQDENETLQHQYKEKSKMVDDKEIQLRERQANINDLVTKLRESKTTSSPYILTHGQRDDVTRIQMELSNVRRSLDESVAFCEKLKAENTMLTSNLEIWVQDQKLANERLGEKIREQSATISNLLQENEQLGGQPSSRSRDDLRATTPTSARGSVSQDKFRALQNHSAQQQALLNQLKAKLEETESEHQTTLRDKNNVIDDLTSRLKQVGDNLARSQEALKAAEKEGRRLKAELEHVDLTGQSYRVQAESRAQTIASLKAQMEARAFQALHGEDTGQDSRPRTEDLEQFKSVIDAALRDSGATDVASLDKTYWIQRVMALSQQLQENSEYWSEQVRQLSGRLDRVQTHHSISPSPRPSPNPLHHSPGPRTSRS